MLFVCLSERERKDIERILSEKNQEKNIIIINNDFLYYFISFEEGFDSVLRRVQSVTLFFFFFEKVTLSFAFSFFILSLVFT